MDTGTIAITDFDPREGSAGTVVTIYGKGFSTTPYETALKLIPESSEALTAYVNKQINRVKTEGPSEGAAIQGFKYILK